MSAIFENMMVGASGTRESLRSAKSGRKARQRPKRDYVGLEQLWILPQGRGSVMEHHEA